MDNPFRLRTDDVKLRTINVSGGRSSAYMLFHILQAHEGSLPANARAVFTNTGKEREETLEFVDRCDREWGVPITWLEYMYDPKAGGTRNSPRHLCVETCFDFASREGEPFEQLIDATRYLPNVISRKCTAELKVKTVERWARRELKVHPRDVQSVLGIRHDEPRRWKKALMEECKTEYPLVHAKTTQEEVQTFWKKHSFDLGIDSDQSNCDLCFLKGRNLRIRDLAREPERALWWLNMERKLIKNRPWRDETNARFDKNISVLELLLASARFDQETPVDSEEDISCFCGD